jgi:hypothetical protein
MTCEVRQPGSTRAIRVEHGDGQNEAADEQTSRTFLHGPVPGGESKTGGFILRLWLGRCRRAESPSAVGVGLRVAGTARKGRCTRCRRRPSPKMKAPQDQSDRYWPEKKCRAIGSAELDSTDRCYELQDVQRVCQLQTSAHYELNTYQQIRDRRCPARGLRHSDIRVCGARCATAEAADRPGRATCSPCSASAPGCIESDSSGCHCRCSGPGHHSAGDCAGADAECGAERQRYDIEADASPGARALG